MAVRNTNNLDCFANCMSATINNMMFILMWMDTLSKQSLPACRQFSYDVIIIETFVCIRQMGVQQVLTAIYSGTACRHQLHLVL